MADLLQAIWHYLLRVFPGNDELAKQIILSIIGTAIAVPLFLWLMRKLRASLKYRWTSWITNRDAQDRLARARSAVTSDAGVWLAKRGPPPERYELILKTGIPILVVGHLKGGVGKTTVAANLAAYYADQGESVLAIDLDFQGSQSSMVLPDDKRRPSDGELSRASLLIDGTRDPAWVIANAWPMRSDLKLFAIPAFYDLARTENRLMVEWLIKDQPEDMPYFLARLLLTPHVQGKYQRIIIDAPPRLTTACIQALCSGTHLLIPTILDKLSAEAVTTFVNEVETLKKGGLCPHLKYAGIVGTMLNRQARTHEPVVKTLQDQLREAGVAIELLPEQTWIPEMAAISRQAGDSLAYFSATPAAARETVREAFRNLGVEVAERMKRR